MFINASSERLPSIRSTSNKAEDMNDNYDNDMMDQCTGIHSGKTIYIGKSNNTISNVKGKSLTKRKRDDRSHSRMTLHHSGSISSCTHNIVCDNDEFDSEDLIDHPAKSLRRGDTSVISSADRVLLPAPYYYYHDHSKDAVTEVLSTKNAPSIFLLTMHDILNREDLQSIICWMPHGRSWKILNKHAFEDRVLPNFFRAKKMASFISNARRWGFKRYAVLPIFHG